jgi:acetyl-CoA C-acetyltransferase
MVSKPKVSIIGVGCTPFGSVLSTPGLKGKTFQELITEACHEAMDDAGVNPVKDIDAFFMGNMLSHSIHQYSVNTQVCDWVGMQGKPTLNFATACSTTNVGVGLAANSIMSGKYKCVLVTAGEIITAEPEEQPDKMTGSPLKRKPLDIGLMFYWTMYGNDQIFDAYIKPAGLSYYGPMQMVAYAKKYGLDIDTMDKVEFKVRSNDRIHASLNPRALMKTTLEQEAKKAGYDDAFKYWQEQNPISTWPQRAKSLVTPADGASAYIVCDARIAKKLTNKIPVDVLGWGWSGTNHPYFSNPLEWTAHKLSYNRAYKMAGITGKQIDHLSTHSCSATMAGIHTAEMAGYFKPGTGWKAILDGRTLYTGDKPMNTTGSRHAFGHAWTASAGAEIYELVKQMRGEAGKRQCKNNINIGVVQNEGALFQSAVTVFKKRGGK